MKDVGWVPITEKVCFEEFYFFVKGQPVGADIVSSVEESFNGVNFELFWYER